MFCIKQISISFYYNFYSLYLSLAVGGTNTIKYGDYLLLKSAHLQNVIKLEPWQHRKSLFVVRAAKELRNWFPHAATYFAASSSHLKITSNFPNLRHLSLRGTLSEFNFLKRPTSRKIINAIKVNKSWLRYNGSTRNKTNLGVFENSLVSALLKTSRGFIKRKSNCIYNNSWKILSSSQEWTWLQ